MSGPPVEPASGDSTPSTILIVEPDILVRMVIAAYLRGCGYAVVEGVTAADAFTVLEAGRNIDIILAEVQLTGGVDGFALAQRIRESHPEIDILLTSGIDKAADKAGDLCEDGPLEKPYHPQEVVRRIHILREGRRSRQKS
jgi:CheY-like chemotaxis protein